MESATVGINMENILKRLFSLMHEIKYRRQNPANLSFAKTTFNVVAVKVVCVYLRGRIQRKTLCVGLYAGDDLTLCPLQSRLQHTTLCQSRLYPPVRDFGFEL
jgi:hypothetical protein